MTSAPPLPASEHPLVADSARKQKAYARKRRTWGAAVGRPYDGDEDTRPPPGELDVAAAADD
ncbi:MAG: hypothetical protein KGL69_08010 [Alphaproteobacteria bacterium]|nr:hypothetical protein [Alphaproteobacteria bacterium]